MTLKEKREHVKSVLMPAARKACLEVIGASGYSEPVNSDGTLVAGVDESLWFFVNHWAKQAYKMRPFPFEELAKLTLREGRNMGKWWVREMDKAMRADFGADCLG
jgi:hypothetical protein